MKKYIKTTYFISFFLIVSVLVSVSFLLFVKSQRDDIRNNMRTVVESVSHFKIPENIDYNKLAYDIGEIDHNLRVTLIHTDGYILGDSNAEYTEMENHLSRKEIKEAIGGAIGEDVRTSKTIGIKSMYIAKKVNDEVIVRLSYQLSGAYEYLSVMAPIIIALCVLMLIVINVFAKRFSEKLISPLYHINSLLEGNEENDAVMPTFSDIEPIINNIGYLINKLNYDFAEIQKTQKMRSDFVANVSHELKSPLTSVKGFAELLSSGMVPDEKRDDYLRRIVSESDRLLDIIEDILKLSEAESRKEVEVEKLNLREIASEVNEALETQAHKKNISVSIIGGGSITANKKEIWELIYNLVDNAIKYGNENGYVKIEIAKSNIGTRLAVSDNGIGIPKEHTARIFERFYRVDKSHSRKSGGTGLGLSIVKNVANRYGAVVSVKSEIGKGSTFEVEFPDGI